MKRAVKCGAAGFLCLSVIVFADPAYAMRMMPQPLPLRVARAEVVVLGKVTKIEDKMVSAPSFPGAKDKVEYQIAVVKVDDPILNAKGMKEIRVGFIPAPAPGGVGRPPVIIRYRGPTLTEDEEVCLLLTKHADGDFYIIDGLDGAIKKANNPEYAKQLEEAKKAAKLIADPLTSLKSKDAEERFQTAAMMIEHYRTVKQPVANPPKQEPIDAAESKLILEALRDADWTPRKPMGVVFMMLTPLNSFSRLQLTKDDNWTAPTDGKIAEGAQAWLKDNAGTYRIKKFIADTKDEKKDK